MTKAAPKWLTSENIIEVKDDKHRLRPECMLLGLKDTASQEEKDNFEKEMNEMLKSMAKLVFPEMESPYYTWSGKIVDRKNKKRTLEDIREDWLKRSPKR